MRPLLFKLAMIACDLYALANSKDAGGKTVVALKKSINESSETEHQVTKLSIINRLKFFITGKQLKRKKKKNS